MTKAERDKIRQEIESISRIIRFHKSGTYTRFCVTLLDDRSKKYADLRIEDLEDQNYIIKRLKRRLKMLEGKLKQTDNEI